MTSPCLFFLAFVFLGIGFFFRNVIERLVKVERFGSNKQNVLNEILELHDGFIMIAGLRKIYSV